MEFLGFVTVPFVGFLKSNIFAINPFGACIDSLGNHDDNQLLSAALEIPPA
jgi:hypothetical protein